MRAITAAGKSGRWSRVQSIAKKWSTESTLLGPDEPPVGSKADALVLRWTPVEGAYKYFVTVATDESLAKVVIGAREGGVTTSGTVFALPTRLARDSTYYWAVTPLDAGGHRGKRSDVGKFTLEAWKSRTTTGIRDASDNWPNFNPLSHLFDRFSPFFGPKAHRLGPDASGAPRVLDPELWWEAIPNASTYEVEVNHSQDFAAGSKMCCKKAVSETSMYPPNVLANNAYHWRVRGLDGDGNAGEWNYGPVFRKDFDLLEDDDGPLESVRNLRLVPHAWDPGGTSLDGVPLAQTRSSPGIRWSAPRAMRCR